MTSLNFTNCSYSHFKLWFRYQLFLYGLPMAFWFLYTSIGTSFFHYLLFTLSLSRHYLRRKENVNFATNFCLRPILRPAHQPSSCKWTWKSRKFSDECINKARTEIIRARTFPQTLIQIFFWTLCSQCVLVMLRMPSSILFAQTTLLCMIPSDAETDRFCRII